VSGPDYQRGALMGVHPTCHLKSAALGEIFVAALLSIC
jgi:hypothetical protein